MLNSTSSGAIAIEVAVRLGITAAIELTLSSSIWRVRRSSWVSLSVGPELGKAFDVDSTRPRSPLGVCYVQLGPVITAEADVAFAGARQHTKNTAELRYS